METLAVLALAKLLHTSPAQTLTRSQIVQGSTISCVTVDKAAVKRCAGLPRSILFECVNLNTGEVSGAVTTRNGFVQCAVTGAVGTNALGDTCADVTVCGRRVSACLHDPSTLGMLQCLGLL